jgi:hypothetical protein
VCRDKYRIMKEEEESEICAKRGRYEAAAELRLCPTPSHIPYQPRFSTSILGRRSRDQLIPLSNTQNSAQLGCHRLWSLLSS